MSIIAFSPVIGPVFIDCVLREAPENNLDITEIPVETGARITDHAIIQPKKITIEVANHNASITYNQLVAFQESREPFTLITGLNIFENMLIKRISAERDASFSSVLRATIDLQEVIIVSTAYDPKGEAGKTKAKKGQSKKNATTSDKSSPTNNQGDQGGQTPAPRNVSGLKRAIGG